MAPASPPLFTADIRRRGIEKTDGTSLVANFLAAAESSQDEITDEVRVSSPSAISSHISQ